MLILDPQASPPVLRHPELRPNPRDILAEGVKPFLHDLQGHDGGLPDGKDSGGIVRIHVAQQRAVDPRLGQGVGDKGVDIGLKLRREGRRIDVSDGRLHLLGAAEHLKDLPRLVADRLSDEIAVDYQHGHPHHHHCQTLACDHR